MCLLVCAKTLNLRLGGDVMVRVSHCRSTSVHLNLRLAGNSLHIKPSKNYKHLTFSIIVLSSHFLKTMEKHNSTNWYR